MHTTLRSGRMEAFQQLNSACIQAEWAKHLRPKSKQRIFYSAVALFTEKVFNSESLLVTALIKIPSLVENPSQPGRGV